MAQIPLRGVVLGGNGDLYGTAVEGGCNQLPVEVALSFSLTARAGRDVPWTGNACSTAPATARTAVSTNPESGLIFDASGDLYGTALGGYTHGGVVFRLKPPKSGSSWPLTVLENFTTGVPRRLLDHPTAGLVFDNKGNLYSTTEDNGAVQAQSCQGGCGTVYEVSP